MARNWPRVLASANDLADEPKTVGRPTADNLIRSCHAADARVTAAKAELRAALIDQHEANARFSDHVNGLGLVVQAYVPELELPPFLEAANE